MDFLEEHERKLENITVKKEKELTRQEVPLPRVVTKRIVEEKTQGNNSSFSVCTSCGKKQPVLLEGTYCPSCGKESLVGSGTKSGTKSVVKKNISDAVSHAEALMDDDASMYQEGYVSPLAKMFKTTSVSTQQLSQKEEEQLVDHASSLLGEDTDPVQQMFIPMPDFSALLNRKSQQPVVENKIDDPRLRLMSVPPVAVDPGIEAQMKSLGLSL